MKDKRNDDLSNPNWAMKKLLYRSMLSTIRQCSFQVFWPVHQSATDKSIKYLIRRHMSNCVISQIRVHFLLIDNNTPVVDTHCYLRSTGQSTILFIDLPLTRRKHFKRPNEHVLDAFACVKIVFDAVASEMVFSCRRIQSTINKYIVIDAI